MVAVGPVVARSTMIGLGANPRLMACVTKLPSTLHSSCAMMLVAGFAQRRRSRLLAQKEQVVAMMPILFGLAPRKILIARHLLSVAPAIAMLMGIAMLRLSGRCRPSAIFRVRSIFDVRDPYSTNYV